MMTEEQKERIKKHLQLCNIDANPKNKMVKILYYSEFNPLDYGAIDSNHPMDFNLFMNNISQSCKEAFDQEFDWLNFKIGRLENNAELHFIKCSLWVDNPFYADTPDEYFEHFFSKKQVYGIETEVADQNLFNAMQQACLSKHGRGFERSDVLIKPAYDGADTSLFRAKLQKHGR